MLMVDLNYNFEFDWFVELSDNKLSDNKLRKYVKECITWAANTTAIDIKAIITLRFSCSDDLSLSSVTIPSIFRFHNLLCRDPWESKAECSTETRTLDSKSEKKSCY